MGVKGKFVQSEILNLYTRLDEGVYPVPGIYAEYLTRRRDPPLCEVPDIYVGYRIYKIRLDRVCVQCFCISRFFFFFHLEAHFNVFQWVPCTVYETHKPLFSTKLSLKMGLMTLFIHLKIILLLCFQFLAK